MARVAQDVRSREGDGGGPLRFTPPAGQARRPRLSWVALGLVVLLAAGLLGAVVMVRAADRQPVLVLAQPIQRGQQVTEGHLRTVGVASDGEVALLPAADRAAVVGRTAVASLPAGTLLSRDHLSSEPAVPEGWSVVGLALEAGQYPVGWLAAGDRVLVVRTPRPAGGPLTGGSTAEVLSGEAEVFAVEVLSDTSRALLVSVAVPEAVAPQVAGAAAEGRIRLVLVPPR